MSAMQISQRRSGVIAKKIGMTRVFHDDGIQDVKYLIQKKQ